MLTLHGHALVDKQRFIGGCLRLRDRFDLDRLSAEIAALPQSAWGSRGGRVGVHNAAEAIFLRGYAPAEGDRPVEDREVLAALPYARELIHERMQAAPMRCLLAKLPAQARIAPHIDQADYFAKTIRLHFPVITNSQVGMYCAGHRYFMLAGEIWALNNSDVHAVWNGHEQQARIHMIADFLPSPQLLALLDAGERNLGIATHDLSPWLDAGPGVVASA